MEQPTESSTLTDFASYAPIGVPRVAGAMAEDPAVRLEQLVTRFVSVQSHYADRAGDIAWYRKQFNGEHWDVKPTGDEFQLTINYCRRVILDFAGMLARAPIPRVPYPSDAQTGDKVIDQARKRERLLDLVWDDLLTAWQDVELDADQCGYGVLEALWAPKETDIEMAGDPPTKVYKGTPIVFRAISPERFYPVYRTFDKPDDFLYVYRSDPSRLCSDLEAQYGVLLQGQGLTLDVEKTCDLVEYWDDKYYILIARTQFEVPIEGTGIGARFARATGKTEKRYANTLLWCEAHGYGRIPFWVLQNIRNGHLDPTTMGSLSDIDDIVELNKHLNLMRSEQAEEIITNIHRPLVYSSDDHQQNPNDLSMTAGAVYPIGEKEKLEPVPYMPQPQFIQQHLDDTEHSIRMLSFLGEAGFGEFGSGVSGVAARIALTPMQRILELKLPTRIRVLMGVSSFVLRTFESKIEADATLRGWVKVVGRKYNVVDITKADIGGQYDVDVSYGNLLPRDDDAFQQHQAFLYSSGLQPLWDTLDKIGVEDPDAVISRLTEEAKNVYINPKKYMEVQQALSMPKPGAAPTPAAPTTGVTPLPAQATNTPGNAPAVAGRAQNAPPAPPAVGGAGAGMLAPFLQRQFNNSPTSPTTTPQIQGPGNQGGGG